MDVAVTSITFLLVSEIAIVNALTQFVSWKTKETFMRSKKKDQICALLKGIETGDPEAVTVVNEGKYIQHNPLTREGNVGLAELFKRLSKTSPRVEIVRVFEDGDFVFAHTDYDFNVVEVGFEVFRFEDGLVVEHWDNLQSKPDDPNPSGHTMLDGSTETTDLDKTEENRALIRSFVEEALVGDQLSRLDHYIDSEGYVEHNLKMSDGLPALREALANNREARRYDKIHRLLAEGNFVLCVCEGHLDDRHVSFYDLFRVADGKIVEHWDTVDPVPPRSEWVNNNGKF
ncbi:MAG: putative SnoaL-like aldol condensation-catalyzing enzyme [Verrucomicrobiales bacterium]